LELEATGQEAPGQARPAAVSVRDVTKSFGGGVLALDAVSLDVRRGEFLSLLGPSGCGKTTLLRIIGGFEEPTRGDVLIGGHSVLADPPYRRRTNMIFQHLALFPHLTAAQNIAFGLELRKLPRAEIERRVKEALALVRMPGYEGRQIDELSGGQRQRIAIARAIVNDPEVLLLDEPLGALDLQLRLQMHDELRRIHRETRRTFIFVTHDQGEAISLSDRIAVMSEGRIVQLGTPRDIYERPAVRTVAQFVGHANYIEGRLEGAASGARACTLVAGEWRLEGRAGCDIPAGAAVVGVIRYEKLSIGANGGLPASVVEATYLGPTVRVTVRLESGRSLIAELPSTQANASPGTAVRVAWAPENLVVLPA
jgi:spermidine/putrescine transport system ATP-binding protein